MSLSAVAKYYSSLSTLCEALALVAAVALRKRAPLLSSALIAFFVVNAIAVGVVGAAVVAYASPAQSSGTLLRSNFMMHALPSFFACCVFMYRPRRLTFRELQMTVALLVLLKVVYSVLPHKGVRSLEKVQRYYGCEPTLLVSSFLVTESAILFLIS
jgi:hypothetical protein